MLLILVVFAPLIMPLWLVASGVFSFYVGRTSGSARLGWLFFLILSPLPLTVLFALLGAVFPAILAGIVAGGIVFLLILDWYGADPDLTDEGPPGHPAHTP
ncbi:hypothetical protein ACIPPM_25605 [Streptomyces sp. NPDC090119]|uniref:hypothetical protein n=1 Tax=Streptomyces sp. NPDC090119 TaxID=3365951 RepID=UPI00381005BE